MLLLTLDARFDEAEQVLVARDWTRPVHAAHSIILLGGHQGSL